MKRVLIALLLLGSAGAALALASRPKSKAAIAGDYRVEIYLGDGGYFAQIFIDGMPSGPTIGPEPSEDDAAKEGSRYLASIDRVAFYTLHAEETAPGQFVWFWDGWSLGDKVKAHEGPFASKEAAGVAASAWVAAQESSP